MNSENPKIPFVEAVRSKQSYKNIAYLLLTFPTGLLYFIMMVVGASLGTSLVVIGVGVLILWLTMGSLLASANGERWLAGKLLQLELDAPENGSFSFDAVSKRESWKAMLFLFLKFPLGILSFSVTTSVISFILGLITMPLFYQYEFVQIGGRSIDNLWEAFAATLFGIILLPIALMFLNKMALWWRRLANRLLNVAPAGKTKRMSERDMIEAEILQRLVDEGRLDSDTMVEYQGKRKNEVTDY